MKLSLTLFLLLVLILPVSGWAKNGFDLSNVSVPAEMIQRGGPPKDGIPAINSPVFESAEEASWLSDEDRVLGLSINGEHRAYPVSILNWHEIVNDQIGGQSVVVTFCPLCGTGMVFSAQVDGEALNFGVSGLLFESDVLLYDRGTESLWSQLWMEGVSGDYRGKQLELLVSEHTTWGDWRENHPNTQVLSRDTGFSRDYRRNPYQGYDLQRRLYFPVENTDESVHPKEWVLGVIYEGAAKAWTFSALADKPAEFLDTIGGHEIRVEFDSENEVGRVWRGESALPVIQSYWFAWYAFYPEADVIK